MDSQQVSRRPRKYTGVLQYFHNFEHSKEGRTHCKSTGKHPYNIEHQNGRHIISHSIALGHGRGGKPQWFYFTKQLNGGYDMSSGVKIAKPPRGGRRQGAINIEGRHLIKRKTPRLRLPNPKIPR